MGVIGYGQIGRYLTNRLGLLELMGHHLLGRCSSGERILSTQAVERL